MAGLQEQATDTGMNDPQYDASVEDMDKYQENNDTEQMGERIDESVNANDDNASDESQERGNDGQAIKELAEFEFDKMDEKKMRLLIACTICSEASREICHRCESVAYCSSECRETDKKLHENICEHYYAFVNSLPARPTGATVGIYFGHDDAIPRFVWVEYSVVGTSPDGAPIRRPQLARHFQHGVPGEERLALEIQKLALNNYRSKMLQHTFFVASQSGASPADTETYQNLPPNRCIDKLTKGYSMLEAKWRGSFLLFCRDYNSDSPGFVDATLTDYRGIVDICKFIYLLH